MEAGPFRPPRTSADLVLHELGHTAFGALAALPTLRIVPIIAGAAGAVLFDADHIGYYLGLPMHGRASHSVLFILLAPVVAYFVARKGILGHYVRPVVAASLAAASILAHLAYDAITADGFPIWAPFWYGTVSLTPSVGVLVELAAMALTLAASRWKRRSSGT